MSARERIEQMLQKADVEIDGDRPWDIQVNKPEVFDRVLAEGRLGVGESYMDGWWDCEELDVLLTRCLNANLDQEFNPTWRDYWLLLKSKYTNRQNKRRAYTVGEQHYDKGNELYRTMLDDRMVYSCAYWKNADSLNEAQENKLDLICRKLKLKEGERLLDIGCGWGSLARYAAEEYGVEVTGITVSEEQVKLAREKCEGLPVEIKLKDYRDMEETFDKVVSVGMFEHVGYKNYPTYMEVVHRCMKPEGLTLLHTIGSSVSVTTTDPWIDKYIFPNGMLPSASQITEASEEYFNVEDWHNFGLFYDTTLMAWHENFVNGWEDLPDRYDETFFRMWEYYLLSSAATFRSRSNHVWQIVFSRQERKDRYETER